jgi:alpha-L-fucosidase
MSRHLKLLIAVIGIFLYSFHAFPQKKNKKVQSIDKIWGEAKVSIDALKEGRAKLFNESNFGMFIHWGLFSELGGKWKGKTYYAIGEWIMSPRVAGIPPEEYVQVASEFNPIDFDAKSIAQLAKDAGMKYIIITSKHHEGFAMFDSKADDFNIVDATPFGRDPMKELSEACREIGLGFGFYYSHNQDWTAPGGTNGPTTYEDGSPATFEEYFYRKCKPQVREICTNYGDIDFIWFDTPGNMKKELVVEMEKMVRELQPNAMLGSRIGHGLGDYVSLGDMEVPPVNHEGLWETCDTNNDSWAYAWYENNFKGPKEILHRLISTIGRGGTYLFNIGPDAAGNVPEIGAQFLKETGVWIKKYPQVIYGVGSSPWGHALSWGDVTTKENSLFLSVFDWPQDGKLYLPGLESHIISAEILEGETATKIDFEKDGDWTVFKVPYKPADAIVSIIELKLDVKANGVKVNGVHGVYPNIETEILTDFAIVNGAEKKSIRWMEKFGEWKKTTQVSKWTADAKTEFKVNVLKSGYYYLDLSYKGEDRLVWKTTTDEGGLVQNQQAATDKYAFNRMGIIEFKSRGEHTLTVSLIEGNRENSSLKSIKLYKVK